LRSIRNREGAFSIYKEQGVEVVGYTSCGDCSGGNIEYAPEEMIKPTLTDEKTRFSYD
jgi:predicted metal-binding protein